MDREREQRSVSTAGSAPRIWSCGGGKGGVGKSVVIANLAVALARAGERCILIDADLGGANLHTLFGLPHPRTSLAELFTREAGHLRELAIPTAIPGLQLISGSLPLMEMANPHHAQKLKLLRQLAALDVDHVLLDLGAGSAFNVLDFFLAGSTQLLVVTPQPTSVENAYQFLKAAFFRRLKQLVRQAGIGQEASALLQDRRAIGQRTPGAMLKILEQFSVKGAAVAEGMRCFAPQIIVNQVRCEMDRNLGRQMAAVAGEYFGLPVRPLGSLDHDDRVHAAIGSRQPVLDRFPQCSFSLSIRELCQPLLAGRDAHEQRASVVRSV